MDKIFKLLKITPEKIEELKGDGSNRKFFRIFLKKESFILILPQKGKEGIKEAEKTFIIGNFLKKQGIPVPEIKFWDKKTGILLVEDLGDLRLYEAIKNKTYLKKYFQAIEILVSLQQIEKSKLLTLIDLPVYNKDFILEKEVLYGINALYKISEEEKLKINKKNLNFLESWIERSIKNFAYYVLVHRDFQSKNIMLKGSSPYLIDFQGMIIGPPSYDLASLLYDPYANLKEELRKELINYYLKLTQIDREAFYKELKEVRCFRILQALGAFKKLSDQGKSWFKNYIPVAIKLLKDFGIIQKLKNYGFIYA